MKILVISSTVFQLPITGYGGLEVVAYETAKGLAAKGHEVVVVAPDGSQVPGCQVIECGPAGHVDEHHAYGGFPDFKQGEQVVRPAHPGYWQYLQQFDIIIDSSWNKWCYQLKAEGKLRAPILGVMHAPVDTMYKVWPPQFPGLPRVEKPCAVCISQDQADHFRALHDECDVRVCRNGVDLDVYRPLEMNRTNRFLFLARFSTIKGPDIAIQVCRDAGVGLDLIGDMAITQEPDLFQRCQEMCDGKQIRMVGSCSRGNTVWWYNRAHCMLHPNARFREPLGLAPLESMACGTPVIAWDRGAMRETIKQGVSGYLVKSTPEMLSVVKAVAQDPFFMGGSREQCREWASRFSLQKMVSRYEELCTEALDSGGW